MLHSQIHRFHRLPLLLALALLPLTNCHCAARSGPPAPSPAPAVRPPPNFAIVHPGLYRGGHPDAGALDYLRSIGVRTIVNLEIADLIEATEAQIAEEDRNATARGMRVVHVPISAFEPALSARFDALIDLALRTMADPASGVTYVHCLHGQDRTGMVIGLERVLQEHWMPDRAWAEMVQIGFHPMFLGLDEYFERKSGWERR